MLYSGHCHCGAVKFEVEAPAEPICQECNCSICRMSGYLHLIVAQSAFRLIRGQDALAVYTFNTGVAKHYFCRTCGIKSFYIPRSNPDCVDVNVRCLDPAPGNIVVENFDGHNWEANVHKLRSPGKTP